MSDAKPPSAAQTKDPVVSGWRRKGLPIGVATLVVLALALYLLRNVLLGTPTPVYAVQLGGLVQSVVASGRIISPQRVTVALQGTGRVLRVAVAQGQAVKKGQLLIELDNSDGLANVQQAQAAVTQAQTKLKQQSELSQPLAEQALAQAKATAQQAQMALDRNRGLLEQGFVSQAVLDDALSAVEVLTAQVASAQLQVLANQAGGTAVLLAEAALRQAQGGLNLAHIRLEQGRVVAPSDGVLISRSVEVGDIVQAGKALMVLATSGPAQILVQIDEKHLSKIALGQKAYASADAFAQQRFDAVVVYINPGVDAARGQVEVKLDIVQPPDYLRQDMTVSVDIETARRADTLVMATNAVQDAASDAPWVLVVRDRQAEKQGVTLGVRGDTRVEILSGLNAGDWVVPVSKLGVTAGQRVRGQPSPMPVDGP
ncbi:MAG: hypothetical protein RL297_1139 [Pseudomonadota bacterium]|jgi:HlyD family secretion protein